MMTKPIQLSLLFNKLKNSPSDDVIRVRIIVLLYRHYYYNLTEASVTKLHIFSFLNNKKSNSQEYFQMKVVIGSGEN